MFRVSFTGHRPNKLPYFSEDDPMCEQLKERLKKQIVKLIDEGAEEFCSGMALGVDTWAAEAVLELKETYANIRLTAVIPCPDQAKSWTKEDQARYQSILSRCDQKIMTSKQYIKGCMQKRNCALVNMCDVLIAVFDGTAGGTKNTVDYAKSKNKRIEIVPVM